MKTTIQRPVFIDKKAESASSFHWPKLFLGLALGVVAMIFITRQKVNRVKEELHDDLSFMEYEKNQLIEELNQSLLLKKDSLNQLRDSLHSKTLALEEAKKRPLENTPPNGGAVMRDARNIVMPYTKQAKQKDGTMKITWVRYSPPPNIMRISGQRKPVHKHWRGT